VVSSSAKCCIGQPLVENNKINALRYKVDGCPALLLQDQKAIAKDKDAVAFNEWKIK